jgi:hypothetical protein
MTVPSDDARSGPYSGNGSTTVFAYDFKVLDEDHLVVTLTSALGVETTQTITTHYTVSGVGVEGGGNITMVTAPASGTTLTVTRDVPITQLIDLQNRGGVQPATLETAYDKLTQIAQDNAEFLARVPRFPVSSTETAVELPLTLTATATLTVNAAGDGFENGPTTTQITNAEANATAAAASASAAGAAQTAAEAAQTAAVAAANGFTAVTAITTGTTNLETTDARTYYKVDASGGTVTINLPAIGANDGLVFVFEVVNVDNAITVVRDGTDYINDVNGNYTGLDTVGKTIQFIADDNTPDNWVTTVITQVPQATSTEAGKVELAIASEVNTGTDATRAVSPDALAGSNYGTAIYQVMVFNDATDCATGDGAGDIFLRIPSTLNGFDLVGVAASCQTAGTTGTMDIQIHNVTQAADMLTTKITIDSAETDSSTAATPAAIDTANDDVATGDQLRIDVDAAHTTAAKGLLVEMQFRLP